MRIRIVQANVRIVNHNVRSGIKDVIRKLRWYSLKPDVFGLQETANAAQRGYLRDFPHYTTHFHKPVSHWNNDNMTLLHKRNKFQSFKQVHAANGVKHRDGRYHGTAPRQYTVTTFKRGKHKFAHFDTHTHVLNEKDSYLLPENKWSRAAKQYKKHVILMTEDMKRYKKLGYIVTLTSDDNADRFRVNGKLHDWEYSLYHYVQKHLGMKVEKHHIDMIAWFPDQLKKVSSKWLDKDIIHSDHPTGIVKLDVK